MTQAGDTGETALLVPLNRATATSCGRKAFRLQQLVQRGYRVPPALCLPVSIYEQALGSSSSRLVGAPREDVVPGGAPASGRCHDPQQLEQGCVQVRRQLGCWRPAPELERELAAALTRLGPLAVRSSASCEDGGGATPGLFHSTLGVEQPEQLLRAIVDCWSSLWSVTAWLVLQRSGSWPGAQRMAVLLQQQVRGSWSGLALSRCPGADQRLRLEATAGPGSDLADGRLDPFAVQLPHSGELPRSSAGPPPAALEAVRRAALDLEQRLPPPVELEWIFDGQLWLVQARPSPATTSAAVAPDGTGAAPGFRWDREHNPEPLSPAHASLIGLVDPEGAHLRVVQGYLHEARGAAEPPAHSEPGESAEGVPLEQLWRRFAVRSEERLAALRRQLEQHRLPWPELLRFIVQFVHDYFGAPARARRQARLALVQLLRAQGLARPETLAARLSLSPEHSSLQRAVELDQLADGVRHDPALQRWLESPHPRLAALPSPPLRQALTRHLQRYGRLSAVWDVAVPTAGEQPELLLRRVRSLARHPPRARQQLEQQQQRSEALQRRVRRQLAPAVRGQFQQLLQQARLARRLEEDDDLLFAEALWLVRRALQLAGQRFVDRGWLDDVDHVFLLTLEQVQAGERAARPPWSEEQLRRRRQRWSRQGQGPPAVQQEPGEGAAPAPASVILRGHGEGQLVRGEVRVVSRLQQLLEQDLSGKVVVCSTLLPALALVLPDVAALITDHGGLLSHAASLARELGVTAVVGAGQASQLLRDGEQVWVDGERGLVLRGIEDPCGPGAVRR